MNNTKEKQARLQVIMAVLALTGILFAEMYLMINFQESYLPIILLGVLALAAVYVLVNATMTLSAEKEARRNEHFENLYKSEKASYIMLKKSFDEIEERLNELQEVSKVPAEEIINAQKGIAKVIINRSKENADAIINSNDQVLERLDEVEETQNTKFSSLSQEQGSKISDVGTQTELKLQDLLVQLKDTEIRLNQAIMSGTKVVAVPNYQPETQEAENIFAEELYTGSDSEFSVGEDFNLDEAFDFDTDINLEEAFAAGTVVDDENSINIEDLMFENPVEEVAPIVEELPVIEETPVVEELPVVEETPVVEELPVIEETPVVEELPPMPDLSDPNKALSADEIAALFANLGGDSAPAEPEVVEEPVIEEAPVEEEKPPMPDLSDPNKVMSADEIAALIANL